MNNELGFAKARGRVAIVLALLSLHAMWPRFVSVAATRYVDANNPVAGDTNPGTEAQPWKTISKATPLLRAGDTLMVKAGTYRETVNLSQSGTATTPITIQAFPGHEGQVVINAAAPVTNWTRCTGPDECRGNPNWGHIYYADVSSLVAAHPDRAFAVRQLFQHGALLPRSRYPDAGWRYPTSIVDPKQTFTDSSLSQPEGYFAGAVCHIKTAVWLIDAVPITAFSRGTITLATSPRSDISTRFGYFITSIVGEINAEGEWAYDPAQKKIFVWPKGEVAENIEFTYRECCLRINDRIAFNIVRALTMRNAWAYGILAYQSHDITIESNTVEYSFDRGIRLQAEGGSCDNNQVIHNTVKYSGSAGINVDGGASHYNIEGNHVYATGVELFGDDMLNGIGEGLFIWGPYGRVYHNRIDRTARGGLYLAGRRSNRQICFNHTSNTGLALSDGGSGLYTAGYHPGPEKDYIHHNIFAEAIGCNIMNKAYEAGLPVTVEKYGGDSPGLYVDEEGNNYIIEHNTVIGSRLAGIYFHWAPGNLVRRNTLYGNGMAQVRLSGRNAERQTLIEDVFVDNILFATDAQQRTMELFMNYNNVHFGQSDRNWFYNPYADTHIHLIRYLTPSSGEHHDFLTLSGWQALSGYDYNSREFFHLSQLPQVTLGSPLQSRIVYNASLQVTNVDLGTNLYCDVQGNGIRGKLTLQPFESRILIPAVAAVVSYQATNPVPANGSQVVFSSPLEWTAGVTAARHDVYLGSNETAVAAADVTSPLFQGRQSGTSYCLQALALPSGRYFWRVDEVETDGTTIHKGAIWTLLVPDHLLIDDFERYTDAMGSRIEDIWIDGSTNHTGAQVSRRSNPTTPWPGGSRGRWSMLMEYDNTRTPFVSRIERRFVSEQNWATGPMNTLSLWLQGDVVSFVERSPGTFTMTAAGADIWGSRDEFRYACRRLEGDGEIVTKVERIEDTHYWAKGGVMIRQNLQPDSAYASMVVTPDGLRAFQNRPINSSSMCFSAEGGAEWRIPSWVKLERRGNQFTGYHSADGINWVRQSTGSGASPNPQTIDMPPSVYVGLALGSHVSDVVTEARFSGVQITGSVTGRWQVVDIGVDHPGNSPDKMHVTIEDGGGLTATVTNSAPAPTNIRTWTEWKIPLRAFIGIDLRRVTGMSIGVGHGETTNPLGTGRIYIDDIRVESTGFRLSASWNPQSRRATLAYPVEPGFEYHVEYCDLLDPDGVWQDLPDGPHNSGIMSVDMSGEQRYFRLRALQQE